MTSSYIEARRNGRCHLCSWSTGHILRLTGAWDSFSMARQHRFPRWLWRPHLQGVWVKLVGDPCTGLAILSTSRTLFARHGRLPRQQCRPE